MGKLLVKVHLGHQAAIIIKAANSLKTYPYLTFSNSDGSDKLLSLVCEELKTYLCPRLNHKS